MTKIALFAVAILAQISVKPPTTVQVRAGTVQGTVTLSPDPVGDPEPILKGTCANLVATAKIGPLTSKAKATGDLTTNTCAFSLAGVGEGSATVSLAFEGGGADFPAGDLASTPVTVRNGETSKVAMAIKWPIVKKQNVAVAFDWKTHNLSCSGVHVKITGAKTLDVDLADNPPQKCSKLVGLVPGTYTFQLFSFVNANPNFQPQTANVVIQPSFPITFKMPEQGGFTIRFYPKTKPLACEALTAEVSQANVVKATLPFKPVWQDFCTTTDTKLLVSPALDLKIKSGNSVIWSGQKTILPIPAANTWEIHE